MSITLAVNESSMHIYDFCKNAKFVDPDYPADITEDVRREMQDMHPSMIIGSGVLGMSMYKITYEYDTNRGNHRNGCRYLFLKDGDPINSLCEYERDIMIEGLVEKHFSNYNFKFPYRAISNVNILEIVKYANAEISIG